MIQVNCPFLNLRNTQAGSSGYTSIHRHRSPYLGEYFITDNALTLIDDYNEKITLGNFSTTQALINCAYEILVATQLKTTPYLVTEDEILNLKEQISSLQKINNREIKLITIEKTMKERVDHTQKANSLLVEFSKQTQDKHAFSKFSPKIEDMILAKISGKEELVVILQYLIKEEFISGNLFGDWEPAENPDKASPFNNSFQFTMKAWENIRGEREKTNTNKVFIATQFQWPKDDNLRAEVMEAIKRACNRLGWKADLVSQGHTDFITDRILSDIRSSKFVIAELTYHNRGVYFESGYARGLGKNVFHIVHKDYAETKPEADAESKRMHFDIQQVQYRKWETPKDVEEKLYDWINSTVGKYNEI